MIPSVASRLDQCPCLHASTSPSHFLKHRLNDLLAHSQDLLHLGVHQAAAAVAGARGVSILGLVVCVCVCVSLEPLPRLLASPARLQPSCRAACCSYLFDVFTHACCLQVRHLPLL